MALTTYIILGRVKAVESWRSLAVTEEKESGETSVRVNVSQNDEQEFVDIESLESFEAFRKLDAVNAHSTDQALRMGAEKHGDGFYVAISERSWKDEEFETETVTRVRAKSS